MQQVLIQQRAERSLRCSIFSASLSQSRGHSLVFPAIQGAYFKIDCTLFKRTLSEGNEAEQNVQEVNNSLECNKT